MGVKLTIDSALKGLATDFARQLSDTGFPVQLHRHRLFMIAEEAGECCCQWLILLPWLVRDLWWLSYPIHKPFLDPGAFWLPCVFPEKRNISSGPQGMSLICLSTNHGSYAIEICKCMAEWFNSREALSCP